MARPTVKKKAVSPVAPVPPVADEPPPVLLTGDPESTALADSGLSGRLQLTREEILGLKLAEAEGRAATFQLALRQLQRENYLAQIDPKGLLKKVGEEIANANKAVVEHKTAYLQAMQAVEKRLGISMKEYSFDETTGVLLKQQ